jgi:hypothetical protein
MSGEAREPTSETELPRNEPRPFSALSDSGLLWLINAAVFHPRGFALALHRRDGEFVGWSLIGDGTEPWQFAGGDLDEKFAAAEATLIDARSRRSQARPATGTCPDAAP